MQQDWKQARQQALGTWRDIRGSIGEADTLGLLTDINAVFALCDKAKEEAGGDADRCRYCLFYDQFGGCREVSGDMSEKVVEKDWEGLRELIDEFIAHLEELEVPREEKAGGA